MRRHAKVINFGIIYGMSDWGLADDLGIGVKQASIFKEKYFSSYPGIQQYFKQTIAEANESLIVKTLFNRARKVNELKDRNFNIREFGKRVVMNTPIQGTAADIIKLAMIKVDKLLQENNFKTRMLLQVHDELVFEVPIDELMVIIPLIEQAMEEIVDFKVKLKVEYNYGYNWSK
jgi:DNA polymerase-1